MNVDIMEVLAMVMEKGVVLAIVELIVVNQIALIMEVSAVFLK